MRLPNTVPSNRQKEVLAAIAKTTSHAEAANKLNISVSALSKHIERLYSLLPIEPGYNNLRKYLLRHPDEY